MTSPLAAKRRIRNDRSLSRAGAALAVVLGLLPSGRSKNALLSRLLRWEIHPSARLEPCLLIRVGHITMSANARMLTGSVFWNVQEVRVGANASIGHWNWIGAASALRTPALDSVATSPAAIILGQDAAVTARHYIDCSGGVTIGAFSVLAGVRSTVLTHEIDTSRAEANLGPVDVGEYCLVCSDVKLVPGSRIPDRSVVAMGAVVAGPLLEEGMLYAGVPARPIHSVRGREFFHRESGTVDIP